MSDVAALAGRIFLAMIFLAAAFGKITNFDDTTRYIAAHGLGWPSLFCVLAIAVEMLGGVSLMLGFHAKAGAVALAFYLIPLTLIFHGGAEQRTHFLKNVAIMGGLLEVTAFGPGPLSLDHRPIA